MTRSAEIFHRSETLMPGGVSSPVRAFRAVGGIPPVIDRGSGAYLWDVDGRQYIDYVGSWGPMILGHAHPAVIEAIKHAAERGTSFGAPTELEAELAEMVVQAVPSIEMVRFVSSGTEATMSALRLARGATGREKILKFAGGYHGHADSLLVAAGSGVMTMGHPDSPGVTAATAATTLVMPYNNTDAVERAFVENSGQIAAVIVEPVAANMGVVPPEPNFLSGLRRITSQEGALLVFDEVITGFRVAYGGAQQLYEIQPDLTCLGKILGGGLPVGAYGGSQLLMEQVAPSGPIYQAGTLSGNPLAMSAGIATLRELQHPGFYERLDGISKRLADALSRLGHVNRVGSIFTIFCQRGPVRNYEDAKRSDVAAFAHLFHQMLARGIYLAPSQFEAWFVSAAHSDTDIESTIQVIEELKVEDSF